jgi:hypothetical protein
MRITESKQVKISIDVDGMLEEDAYLSAYETLLTTHDPSRIEYVDYTTDGLTYTYTWTVDA